MRGRKESRRAGDDAGEGEGKVACVMRCDVLLRPASESSGRSSIRLCLLATNSSSYVAQFLFMRNSRRTPDRCMYVTVLCSRSADGWRGARESFIVLLVRARGGGEESRKPLGVGVGVRDE